MRDTKKRFLDNSKLSYVFESTLALLQYHSLETLENNSETPHEVIPRYSRGGYLGTHGVV